MRPKSIIDLSHALKEPTPCYPGDPGFGMKSACCFPLSASTNSDKGDDPSMVVTVHSLSLGTHTGTHVDAPYHFFPQGKKLQEIEIQRLVGRAVVLDVRHLAKERGRIEWVDVVGSGAGKESLTTSALGEVGPRSEGKADIVLFWTGWDVHWGSAEYFAHPYFSRGVAEKLREMGVTVLGVDVLNPDETPADESVETKDGFGVHEVLLGNGVIICENLRGLGELAAGVGEGEVWVSLMPLSIHDADGAPVRAYGWREEYVGQ
ncbi:putative cyclase [Phlebopus sp. FC_14]|nr:putative cyclase [Phlebopus sp. FC_14]